MEPPSFAGAADRTVAAAPGSGAVLALPLPTGTPPFHYQWSRAGASLDDRFTSSDDAGGVRLTVSAARAGDSGVYTLQASNAAGKDTARVRLEVSLDEAPTGEDPPTFLRRLQDLTVKVGTRTRFLVEIVSSTECKVTWYRNERRLMEAERVALARDGNFWCADVAAVSVDDAGRWTCTAENAGGRASCSAHLNVLVPKAYKRPEFVEELRALLTEQGTVSLECKVVGVPTPVLRWFKDSREIKAGDVFALTANAEDPTSLGTYTCEAVNCMGRAYSSSKVHVVGRASREGSARPSSSGITPEPPPIFTKELEDQFVRICEHLTLSCNIVVPPWPRNVVWYNKEGKVEPGERYHVIEDGVGGYLLEVPSAEWPDEGEWKCVATSAGGRVGISSCYVSMEVPKNYRKPRFMENLQAVLTEEGLVSFECKVVGFPTPVLSWFKDGQELKPGDVYQLTGTNSLGSYCCIARNCMGQASSSAELTVEDIQNQLNEEEKHQLFAKNQAPKFIQGLKSVEAKIDEPFRFTIKVAIPPEPSVLWYRDDQPVDESTRCHLGKEDRGVFNLDIQSLEFLDQAEWKCVAMNDFGHSVTSCFLKLIIPRHYKKPRFLENLQAILSDEGAVNLECKVIGVPQPILKWYKDGEELKPGDIHRIISGQDGTCCLGTYTCEAQNCMGIAASSASLLGFDDSIKANSKKKAEEQALQRNLSLSTIHEERTSQMYDTPVGDITLDDKGEISFSFDGKEVSVSLYETPDLTEEEALQIVEMYADQLSENVTEHNVVELPPLRFVKETSTSGNLLMEAIIIDVSPEYFASPEEDLRTEADVEDISIADENGPPQLSLDQDVGGEDYLEKTMALLSDEKADIPKKQLRKKSDSQKSAEDYFSLSRDQSLSEEKKDDDTQVFSESDLQSFASARSLGKLKSKSSKPSLEDGQESSEPTKTMLFKDDVSKPAEPQTPVLKQKRERRSSRSSRRSSSGSEKSFSRLKEEPVKAQVELEPVSKNTITNEEFKTKISNVSSYLSKVINDVHFIERDIILKSELMSSAATASRSLEIISSIIKPLSEIHSIADAAIESALECKEVSSTLFNNLPKPFKVLQQSLTIVEKCIDVESDNKTLVKKTCVAFIETCGEDMRKLTNEIIEITDKEYLLTDQKTLSEIKLLVNDINTVIRFSSDTIKAKNLLTEASEIKIEEISADTLHLRDTQKAVFELKSPLNSLLCIIDTADSGDIADVSRVKSSEVILNDMSASIQDLQTALEQIECLSVKESTTSLHKYNTEIIETVMESVLKLRSSFEQLSIEAKNEDDNALLKQALTSIKNNLSEISLQMQQIENNVGSFDILQSENKLEVLQKMAQILISLENNLPRLETMPYIKNNLDIFHKKLTRVLEIVIESNESKKYFTLMEICDAINRLNSSINNMSSDNILYLASLHNTMKIIHDIFIKNVFESELNCSILTNITDTLLCVQETLNHAEEISVQLESDRVHEIPQLVYESNKAFILIEHIDHTIAIINTVKSIETTKELQASVTPTLENICPVLEDIKRNIASVRLADVPAEEQILDISDPLFVKTLATPLLELNQNLLTLNQVIVENIESLKENAEVMTAIAEPLHELHTTLQILQQDVISQYGEDVAPYDVSVNIVSAVQNLNSCIVMIQEQPGIEAIDEMSTLEDISGIKTTAETIPSDHLVLPAAEEIVIEHSLEPLNQDWGVSATAQALQSLNEHIIVLQSPDLIDALETLSEVSDFSSLKSVALGLGELQSGIEEILHPFVMESSAEIMNLINASKLAVIAEPMQELHQSLSILDTDNIPIFEHILEMPTEKLYSVLQSISDFKQYLSKCIQAVFPAIDTADKTIEISNKVEALRQVCEHLKDIIQTTKTVNIGAPIKQDIIALEETVDNLLEATDVSKGIQISQVKSITEKLYEKVITIQEELIQFTPYTPEKLAEEAKLIQAIDDIENNIAVLEQYDFVDLSRASDIISCTTPQLAIEIETDSLVQMDDLLQNAVNVVQDSAQETPIADLMILEDFFQTCKNEFSILRYIISKPMSHKKMIRLIQEFTYLQNIIIKFKSRQLELKLSKDIDGCLKEFFSQADENLKLIHSSLLKILQSESDVLFKHPLARIETVKGLLDTPSVKQKSSVHLKDIISKFVYIIEIAIPALENIESTIDHELNNPCKEFFDDNTKSLIAKMEEIIKTTEDLSQSLSLEAEENIIVTEIFACLQKHQNYKDAFGSGKCLIILKCLSECAHILQTRLSKATVLEKTTVVKDKVEQSALKMVLSEMLEPLKALHSQVISIQEQVSLGVDDNSISIDVSSTESIVETMTEIHKEIIQKIKVAKSPVIDEDIDLIVQADKEIHAIQDSLKKIEDMPAVQELKELTKPINDIEKSLQDIVAIQKKDIENEDFLPKKIRTELLQHMNQYIELIEIVEETSAVIEMKELEETARLARELRNDLCILENKRDKDKVNVCDDLRNKQFELSHKLQEAISSLQVHLEDASKDVPTELTSDLLGRFVKISTQLNCDLSSAKSYEISMAEPIESFTIDSELPEAPSDNAKKIYAVEDETTDVASAGSLLEKKVESVLEERIPDGRPEQKIVLEEPSQVLAEKAIDTLKRQIEEFICNDVLKIINELSTVTNIEEVKQSVNIAKELHKNITALEASILEGPSSEIISISQEKQVQLVQQLQNALTTAQEQIFEVKQSQSSYDDTKIHLICNAAVNLQAYLATAIVSVIKPDVKETGTAKSDQDKKVSETTISLIEERVPIDTTKSIDMIPPTTVLTADTKLTEKDALDTETIVALDITTATDNSEQIRVITVEGATVEIQTETASATTAAFADGFAVLKSTEVVAEDAFVKDQKFEDSIKKPQPIILESVGDSVVEQLNQSIVKPNELLHIETLLISLEKYISEDRCQVVTAISEIIKSIDFEESLKTAIELRECCYYCITDKNYIVNIKETFLNQASVSKKLHENLLNLQNQILANKAHLSSKNDVEVIEKIVNTILELDNNILLVLQSLQLSIFDESHTKTSQEQQMLPVSGKEITTYDILQGNDTSHEKNTLSTISNENELNVQVNLIQSSIEVNRPSQSIAINIETKELVPIPDEKNTSIENIVPQNADEVNIKPNDNSSSELIKIDYSINSVQNNVSKPLLFDEIISEHIIIDDNITTTANSIKTTHVEELKLLGDIQTPISLISSSELLLEEETQHLQGLSEQTWKDKAYERQTPTVVIEACKEAIKIITATILEPPVVVSEILPEITKKMTFGYETIAADKVDSHTELLSETVDTQSNNAEAYKLTYHQITFDKTKQEHSGSKNDLSILMDLAQSPEKLSLTRESVLDSVDIKNEAHVSECTIVETPMLTEVQKMIKNSNIQLERKNNNNVSQVEDTICKDSLDLLKGSSELSKYILEKELTPYKKTTLASDVTLNLTIDEDAANTLVQPPDEVLVNGTTTKKVNDKNVYLNIHAKQSAFDQDFAKIHNTVENENIENNTNYYSQVLEPNKADLISHTALEKIPDTAAITNTIKHLFEEATSVKINLNIETNNLLQHIEEFVAGDIMGAIEELATQNIETNLKATISIANELRDSILVNVPVTLEDPTILNVESLTKQAELVEKFNEALSTFQIVLDTPSREVKTCLPSEKIGKISEVVKLLLEDLKVAIGFVKKGTEADKTTDLSKEDSLKQLEDLLQEVSDKIDFSAGNKTLDDADSVRDTLDEVQTIIIKLKRDFDGTTNDTLNETLEDLECSVRSVQLQINEDSPADLLKEACATLRLLVNNMSDTQNIQQLEIMQKNVKPQDVLEKCSTETEQTVQLLEIASKVDIAGLSHLSDIVSSLNNLRNTMKSLKSGFSGSADTLIEKGIEVILNLNQIEDKVFSIEKDIESEQSLPATIRDSIITAVHSVYGSISNMRGTISSIQKQYMFENYGKPSEHFLKSIKHVSAIQSNVNEDTKINWKTFSKSLRNVLNHFEDIKFYINLDKTARLPSDAAFTKIILEDLKCNLKVVSLMDGLDTDSQNKVSTALMCVESNLNNIEERVSLEVKEKIPIFKDIANSLLDMTNSVKTSFAKKLVTQTQTDSTLKLETLDEKSAAKPEIKAIQITDTTEITQKDITLKHETVQETASTIEILQDYQTEELTITSASAEIERPQQLLVEVFSTEKVEKEQTLEPLILLEETAENNFEIERAPEKCKVEKIMNESEFLVYPSTSKQTHAKEIDIFSKEEGESLKLETQNEEISAKQHIDTSIKKDMDKLEITLEKEQLSEPALEKLKQLAEDIKFEKTQAFHVREEITGDVKEEYQKPFTDENMSEQGVMKEMRKQLEVTMNTQEQEIFKQEVKQEAAEHATKLLVESNLEELARKEQSEESELIEGLLEEQKKDDAEMESKTKKQKSSQKQKERDQTCLEKEETEKEQLDGQILQLEKQGKIGKEKQEQELFEKQREQEKQHEIDKLDEQKADKMQQEKEVSLQLEDVNEKTKQKETGKLKIQNEEDNTQVEVETLTKVKEVPEEREPQTTSKQKDTKQELLEEDKVRNEEAKKVCIAAEKITHEEKTIKQREINEQELLPTQIEGQILLETEKIELEEVANDQLEKENLELEEVIHKKEIDQKGSEEKKLEQEVEELRLEIENKQENAEIMHQEEENLKLEKYTKTEKEKETEPKCSEKAKLKQEGEKQVLEKEKEDQENIQRDKEKSQKSLEIESLEQESEKEKMEEEKQEQKNMQKEKEREQKRAEMEKLEHEEVEEKRLQEEKLNLEDEVKNKKKEVEKILKEKEQKLLDKERLEQEEIEKKRLAEETSNERKTHEKIQKKKDKENKRLVKEELKQEEADNIRLQKEKEDQEKLEQENEEQIRLEKEKVEQEEVEKKRLEDIKLKLKEETEKGQEIKELEQMQKEREKEEKRLEIERLEQEEVKKKQLEEEKLKLEAETKKEQEIKEQEPMQKEKEKEEKHIENERLEQENANKKRLDDEKLKLEEETKKEQEIKEQEQMQKEREKEEKRLENERLEQEEANKKRLDDEKLKLEAETKKEQEIKEQEQMQREREKEEKRLENERLEQEDANKKRLDDEKLKLEAETKKEQEMKVQEQMQKEREKEDKRLENERLELEEANKKRLDDEKLKLEAETKKEQEIKEQEQMQKEKEKEEKRLEKERLEQKEAKKKQLEEEKLKLEAETNKEQEIKEQEQMQKEKKKEEKRLENERLEQEEANKKRLDDEKLKLEAETKKKQEIKEQEQMQKEKEKEEKRLENERLEQEEANKKRLDDEKLKLEAETKKEQEIKEQEQMQKEKEKEEKRLENEKLEQEEAKKKQLVEEKLKLEAETKKEQEIKEQEQMQKEKEKEEKRLEKDRLEQEEANKKWLDDEKLKLEAETKKKQEIKEQEQMQKEREKEEKRLENERLEQEEANKKRLDDEKLKLEAETKKEQEIKEQEQMQREREKEEKRLENERLEQEEANKKRLDDEKLKLEAETKKEQEMKVQEQMQKEREKEDKRLENERLELEEANKKRLDDEKLKLEAETKKKQEIKEQEQMQKEKEKEEKRLENERLEQEEANKKRLDDEKLKLEAETKKEQEIKEKEQMQKEKEKEEKRLENERLEQEEAKKRQLDDEKLKLEAETKKEQEIKEQEQMQKEKEKEEKRLENERLEQEEAKKKQLVEEKLKLEAETKKEQEIKELGKEAKETRLQKEKKELEKIQKEKKVQKDLEKEKVEQEATHKKMLEEEETKKENKNQEQEKEQIRLEKDKLKVNESEKIRLDQLKFEEKSKKENGLQEQIKKEKQEELKQQEKEKLEQEEKKENFKREVEALKEKEKKEQEKIQKEIEKGKKRLEKEKMVQEEAIVKRQEKEKLKLEEANKAKERQEELQTETENEQKRLEKEKLEQEAEKTRIHEEKLHLEEIQRADQEKEKDKILLLEEEKLILNEEAKQEKERKKQEKLRKQEEQQIKRLEMEKLEAEQTKKETELEVKTKIEQKEEQQEHERLKEQLKIEENAEKKQQMKAKLKMEECNEEKDKQEKLLQQDEEQKKRLANETAKLEEEKLKLERNVHEEEKFVKDILLQKEEEKSQIQKEKMEKEQSENKRLENEEKFKLEGKGKKKKQDNLRLENEQAEKFKLDELLTLEEETQHLEKEKLKNEKGDKQRLKEKATKEKEQEKLQIEKADGDTQNVEDKAKTQKELKEQELLLKKKKDEETLLEKVKFEQNQIEKKNLKITDEAKQEQEKIQKKKEEEEQRLKTENLEQEETERIQLEKNKLKLEEKVGQEKEKKKQEKLLKQEEKERKRLENEKAEKKKLLEEKIKLEKEKDKKEQDIKQKKEELENHKLEEASREEKETKELNNIQKQKKEEEQKRVSIQEKEKIDIGDIKSDCKKERVQNDKIYLKKEYEDKEKIDDFNSRKKRVDDEESWKERKNVKKNSKEFADEDYRQLVRAARKVDEDKTIRSSSSSEHYIKEYQYEPKTGRCKQEGKEKPRFIDHNHRDYTMEFVRPSGYQEKSLDFDKSAYEWDKSQSPAIYKAGTLMLDAQLRSSAPPLHDVNRSSEPTERRIEVKHRSKALSEARSVLSEKRASASRDIKRKPVFSTYLTDRTAVEGSRVKLTCSVLSSADPKVTWYKNGVNLDNKLKYRTKIIDGLITLEVLNAVPSDSAEYSCTVENENGSVSSSANLKVYPSFEASPIPPTFTRSIRDTYHLAENELVLECRIRGQPLPTITWLKDDKLVSTNERFQAFYLADGVCRLAISSPTPEDSGKYICKAENSVWSDQITHIVNFTGRECRLSPNLATIERSRFNRQALESRRPHFGNVLTDYKVTRGGTIGLQVEIQGAPTRVEWLREGRSVTETYSNARTFVEQGLYTLALADVTERESGLYTCRAWSSHGTVDMNAAITVVQPNEMEGKPAIIVGRPEKDVLISIGEDLNISFRVQGEPKPKVVFMKGIRDITNSQRVCKMTSDDYVKFTVKRSIISDAGTYCILARNAYGCDRAFVTVVVRQRADSENLISDWTYPMDDSALTLSERKYKSVPERIPGEPSVVDGGNNWVSLAWPKPDPRAAAPVLAYKVESWLIGKEGGARWVELGITPLNSFDAFNLKQGEEYHFRVTPRNRYGWGESVQTSASIGVGLAGDRPEFVDILPGQLKVLIGQTANLSCSVKGKPIPEVVWMKNGHDIEEEDRRVTSSFNGFDCNLTIKDINLEDEGRYSCEASNEHGRVSTYARLAVVTDRLIWEADAKLKRERSADVGGEYPPQFTMRLRDRRVQATYPVRLTCQVVGNPPPTITWFRDGEEVTLDIRHNKSQDEHFHTLEIAPTTLEDGGVYEAMARNSCGAISCRCSLVVDKGIRAYVAPEFCCGLEPLYRMIEGDELRITAVVEAYPSVGVTWYRDGVRLRPSRRTIMTLDRDGQIELALAFVTPRDAGVYSCTASNEVGRATTSGKVEVIGDGVGVEKKKTPPLVLSPDIPYSKEPMFIRKPRSSEAFEGDTVIIACEVVGDPKPDVYWLRDFLKPDYYRDATHFKRVDDGPEYRFEIPHAKFDYTGAYSVVAKNVHGEAKAIISLQILAKDPSSTEEHNVRYGRVDVIPRFERNLTDLLCHDGDAIEFECRVSGNPEPDIRWFHYTEIIRECPDFEWSFDEGAARLKIKQVTAEDEGTYTCEAVNNLGKATSSACLVVYPPGEPNTLSQRLRRPPALLSAASTPRSTPRSTPARSVSRTPGPDARRLCSPSRQMAPKFYTYPFNKVVEEGESVVFQCAVKGLPAPWATWDKEGVILTPSARITIREKDEILRILEIDEVTIEDVGVYRITLENDYGRVEATARLEVITQKGKFYAGVRSYSASPRKSLPYRRRMSSSRQD